MTWVPASEPAPHFGDLILMCDDGFWYAGHWEPDLSQWTDLDGRGLPGAVIAWLDINPYKVSP